MSIVSLFKVIVFFPYEGQLLLALLSYMKSFLNHPNPIHLSYFLVLFFAFISDKRIIAYLGLYSLPQRVCVCDIRVSEYQSVLHFLSLNPLLSLFSSCQILDVEFNLSTALIDLVLELGNAETFSDNPDDINVVIVERKLSVIVGSMIENSWTENGLLVESHLTIGNILDKLGCVDENVLVTKLSSCRDV